MFRSLWGKSFLLLLLVSAVGLSATLLLRTMMLRDFRSFLDGGRLDQVFILTAKLEGDWEQNQGWDRVSLSDSAVLALMLGMRVQILDGNGSLLMDTDEALEGLSPLMRRRAVSLGGGDALPSGEFVPYPLFLGGERIGTVNVRFLSQDRSGVFVERSGQFLLLSFLIIGGVVLALSFLASRHLAAPIRTLSSRARAIAEGNLVEKIPVTASDEIGKLTAVFNEMTEKLKTQEDLRRKLISNVAHELRTPLAAIRAELEAMMDGVQPIGEDQVRSIHEETGRLAFIMDGIDDLTQAQASSLSLIRKRVFLAPFFREIVQRFQVKAAENGVRIETDADSDLVAWADPDRLSQIIINLFSNALRAAPRGSSVTIKASLGEHGTLIEVTDEGPGISPEALAHIFERFYKGPGGGLGLGLSIVKELVDAHQGRIDVKSQPGKGTSVKVTLPGENEAGGR